MRIILIILVALLAFTSAHAQKFSDEELSKLRAYEDSLAFLARSFTYGEMDVIKAGAVFTFIPTLVEALKVPGSFYYPFDSIKNVIILYPEDEKFRIFSWQIQKDNGLYRHYGAIQMNTKKGLELYPLYDFSDSFSMQMLDTVTNNERWYGALYYNIHAVGKKKNRKYALFGWDGHDMWSSRKVMEILHFDKNGPIFGAPDIEVDTFGNTVNRLVLEFADMSSITLNYNKDLDIVLYDHLIPPKDKMEGTQFTYLPDGSYEGLEFKDGKWRYIQKVFTYSINDNDNPPVPKPLEKDKEKER